MTVVTKKKKVITFGETFIQRIKQEYETYDVSIWELSQRYNIPQKLIKKMLEE